MLDSVGCVVIPNERRPSVNTWPQHPVPPLVCQLWRPQQSIHFARLSRIAYPSFSLSKGLCCISLSCVYHLFTHMCFDNAWLWCVAGSPASFHLTQSSLHMWIIIVRVQTRGVMLPSHPSGLSSCKHNMCLKRSEARRSEVRHQAHLIHGHHLGISKTGLGPKCGQSRTTTGI